MNHPFDSFARAVSGGLESFGFSPAGGGHRHGGGPFQGERGHAHSHEHGHEHDRDRGRERRGRRGGPGRFGPGGFGPGFGPGDFGFGPGGPSGWGPPPFAFGRRGPRARRGDVRAGILHLLADVDRPMHGYEMIRELQERSGGGWRPSAGSIYPTLQLLEDEGLVASTEDSGKRLYSLTDAGREEIASRGGQAPWEEFNEPSDSPWHEIKNAGMGLMAAAMQGTHAANEDQLRRIAATLREARTKIYRILGDDEGSEQDEASDTDTHS